MHALVPADGDVEEELDDDEAGVINGVKRALATDRTSVEKQTVAQSDKTTQQIGDLEGKIEGLDENIDTKIEGLEEKIDVMQGTMEKNMEAILQKLELQPIMQ